MGTNRGAFGMLNSDKWAVTIVVLLTFSAVAGIVEGFKTRRLDGVEAAALALAIVLALVFGALLWAAYGAEA